MKGTMDKIVERYTDIYYLGCPDSGKPVHNIIPFNPEFDWLFPSGMQGIDRKPYSIDLDNL
jgi:hypothetical protein